MTQQTTDISQTEPNTPSVRAALEAGQDIDATAVARSHALARELGLPQEVVLEAPDRAEAELKARLLEQSPRLAAWASKSRVNAALARDDTNLGPVINSVADRAGYIDPIEMAKRVREHGGISQYQPSFMERLGSAWDEGLAGMRNSARGAAIMVPEALGVSSEYVAERRKEHKADLASRPVPLQSEGMEKYLHDFVRTAPQMTTQIGVTALTGGIGGTLYMGSQIAGGKYMELTEEKVTPERALVAALMDAGLQAPLEMLGLSKFMQIFKTSGAGNIIKAGITSIGTEWLTEWLQKYPEEATKIWGEAVVKNRTMAESVSYFFDHFWEITKEGMYEGLIAAPWGGLGMGGRLATYKAEQRTREFTAAHKAINEKLNSTQIKNLSPEHTREVLEFSGMTESVFLPATDVLTLHQSGVNLLASLEVTEETITQAAAMGHDIEVPVSRLHATLSTDDFAKVSEIMRSTYDAPNIKELSEKIARFEGEQNQVMQTLADFKAEEARHSEAKKTLRTATLEAIRSNPHLSAQVLRHAETPEVYVDSWLSLMDGFARRFTRPGTDRAGLLRHLAVVSLSNQTPANGRGGDASHPTVHSEEAANPEAGNSPAQRVTADDMAAMESSAWSGMHDPMYELPPIHEWTEEARREAAELEQEYRTEMLKTPLREILPWLGHVWGRIDGKSLSRDWPGAYKEILRNHGMGIFKSANKGGQAVDLLADELVRSNIFREGMSADDLVELLKTPRHDLVGWNTFNQPVNPGVDLDKRLPVVTAAKETASAWQSMKAGKSNLVQSIIGTLHNDATGLDMELSATNARHMISSASNRGKGGETHIAAVRNIRELMRVAEVIESYPDRKGQEDVKTLHRFFAPMAYENGMYAVNMAVKEYSGKRSFELEGVHKLYDVKIETPEGLAVTPAPIGDLRHSPTGALEITIREMLSGVKDASGNSYFQSAFHGTPHRFDKFTLDAIGTGEGAQAYGWGLYFAGNKNIAEWYRKKLGINSDHVDLFITSSLDDDMVGLRGEELRTKLLDLLEVTESFAENKRESNSAEQIRSMLERADADSLEVRPSQNGPEVYYKGTLLEKAFTGQLYEADIPESHMLLDWDKPLSEQSKTVREAIKKAEGYNLPHDYLKGHASDPGAILYSLLKANTRSPQAASKYLNSLGIKGIKYLDAGSRDKAEGTYNYVIFDDAAISVLQTYYQSERESAIQPGLNALKAEADSAGIDVSVSEKDGIITVSKIVVPEDRRGNGSGTDFMQRLVNLAEETGSVIALTPTADFGGNKKRLTAWYKDLGFVENKGHNKIFSTQESYVRMPENPSQTFYSNRGGDAPRGSLRIYDDRYLVGLMQRADLSTLFHETAHVFMEEFTRAVDSNMADSSMRTDWDKLQAWLAKYDSDETLGAYFTANLVGHARFGDKAFSDLTADEKDVARRIAKHEHFATGFEVYLMEGKAPSQNLIGVFQRFKDWLLAVYKQAARLGVELNDDIRGVFDRMLAAEEDVSAAATATELHAFTNAQLDALKLSAPERAYVSTLMEAAKAKASERLHRARERERREHTEEWKAQARDELRSNPVYQARAAMRQAGGALDGDYVLREFGPRMAAKIRKAAGSRALSKAGESGVDPEIMAAQFGFGSANDMLGQVTRAKAPRTVVKNIVAAKEAESAAAFDATTFLLETQEAAAQIEVTGKYLAQNLGRESIQQKAFAEVAARAVADMSMTKAMQTGNFMGALRRALTEERHATARGDFAAALEANHKARLNMEFIRESRALVDRQKVASGQIKRFVAMSAGDPVARFAVMDVGHRHALCDLSVPLAESRDPGSIRNWISAREADGYPLYLDDTILYGPGKPWREMPVAQFRDLDETISQIVTAERNQRHILNEEKQRLVDEAVEELTDSIYSHNSQKPQKTVEGEHAALAALAGVNAVHTKTEILCVKLDGGKMMGKAWDLIYKPINQAEDAQAMRFKEVRDKLKGPELFGRYKKGEVSRDFLTKKVFVQEIGERITKENMLAVALNMGNKDNMARLRDGHEWTNQQIAAVVKGLTKADWDFVQAMWDYIGSFREEAFALHEEITGLRPQAVEADPVQTPFGVYKGGYYPIRYNSEKSFKAFSQEQKGLDRELFGGRNHGAATTKKGHLKERGEFGLGSPLLLELSVATDHIFNVVHDICYRKPVLDVAKIINHKAVRGAIETTVGRQHYRELMPWLQDVAGERAEPMHYIHRAMRWARSATSIMQMGFKATTAITQPFGFTQSIELLGRHYAMRGLKTVYGNPLKLAELRRETFEKSPFMAQRISSFDREIRDMQKRLINRGRFDWVNVVRDNAFVPMGWAQMSVDLPTWWGAYEKGIKDFHGNEAKAVDFADSAVRLSQGSGASKDLARVQRGSELTRAFTMFYSYFNTFYNLASLRVDALKKDHSAPAVFAAANTAMLLWFVPAILTELAAGRGPDDDEEAWKWGAKELLQYPFQTVVGLRDIVSSISSGFGYQITPAQSAPASIVNWFSTINKALEKDDLTSKKVVEKTAEAGGYLASLPLKQFVITVGNMWDYLTGEDPDLHVRDLFFVKPKSRR